MGEGTPSIQKFLIEAQTAANDLRLALPSQTPGFNGRRTGSRTGNAYDFAEYRDYHPGDDLRRLDWSVFARSEQLMVRQFNDEIDPSCDLVLDHSASMSVPPERFQAALGLAAFLMRAADNGGFSASLWHAGTTWQLEPNPTTPLQWTSLAADSPQSPLHTIQSFHGTWRPRGLRILLSDLLWPGSPTDFLTRFSQGARQTFLICLDCMEPVSDTEATTILVDAETGESREVRLDPSAVARQRQRLASHLATWHDAAVRAGLHFLRLDAMEVLHHWPIQELARAGLLEL
ncbi:MAG: DUF58 domain-containing protein [Victivallales bacterium]|nr:DUF58 domain-containing protein [Victivallales bacterium]